MKPAIFLFAQTFAFIFCSFNLLAIILLKLFFNFYQQKVDILKVVTNSVFIHFNYHEPQSNDHSEIESFDW
jgi:hypothetical protein